MRRTRGARAAFATAAICALVGLAALAAGPADLFDGIGEAQAHSAQLSPKDGCHKHKAAGERHWHIDGTATRGGECVKQDGIAYRAIERPSGPSDECEHMLKWLAAERTNRSGYYISRAPNGDPLIVKRDADKLVRACRGQPARE